MTDLTHPDLHWFVPVARPKAGDRATQVEEVRAALAQLMAERRGAPLWEPPEPMASHALASVRLLQRIVAVTPFQARRKVIVLGDAERLVVQDSSPDAANAMLKVLEEPPADTVLVLTAADPQALLPTIRSRLVPLRVGRGSDQEVREFLEGELDPPLTGRELERRVLLAEGSIGRALAAGSARDGADEGAEKLLEAVQQRGGAWVALALAQKAWGARGSFSGLLDALAVRIRGRLEEASGGRRGPLEAWLRALRRVEEVRAEAQGNVNPQLALAVLAGDLERLL